MARTITPAPRVGKIVDLKSTDKPVAFPTGGKPSDAALKGNVPRADNPADGKTAGNFKQPEIHTGAGFPQQQKPGTGEVK